MIAFFSFENMQFWDVIHLCKLYIYVKKLIQILYHHQVKYFLFKSQKIKFFYRFPREYATWHICIMPKTFQHGYELMVSRGKSQKLYFPVFPRVACLCSFTKSIENFTNNAHLHVKFPTREYNFICWMTHH